MKYSVMVFVLGLMSCTDTTMAKYTAYGNAHEIKCYSGGVLVYDGRSTGRVQSPNGSDGWQFEDAKTRRLTEVSGTCVIVTLPN